MENERRWWESAVVYQIYPRSFQDTNGDGIGDIAGIRSRLEYISRLGVDAIWLSPIFVSPMVDFGYDVADYRDIAPEYGDIADFDRLVEDAHRLGIRLLLDLVPNHTSDQHQWFVESRRDRRSPKRDWYVWKDAAPDGGPPNNWLGAHGGKAWSWDEATGQYYLHSFQPQMPDLNWENREVREAVYDVMRFWLDRGVDGFRVDVVLRLAKDREFRDEPPNPGYRPGVDPVYNSLLHIHTRDVDHVHDYVREMRSVIDEYGDRLFIGEIYLPIDRLMRYYGEADETHLPFNFGLVTEALDAGTVGDYIAAYLAAIPPHGWPNWVLGNHDVSRVASRLGGGDAGARLANLLLLTLPGTITLYYGDEIGMIDGEIPPEAVVDRRALSDSTGWFNRDRARTPMQWSAAPQAGFTTGSPWLPVNDDFQERNVEAQEADERSVLAFVRTLIELRRRYRLWEGDTRVVATDGPVLVYARGEREGLVVALNLSGDAAPVPDRLVGARRVISTTEPAKATPDAPAFLAPFEGVVFRTEAE